MFLFLVRMPIHNLYLADHGGKDVLFSPMSFGWLIFIQAYLKATFKVRVLTHFFETAFRRFRLYLAIVSSVLFIRFLFFLLSDNIVRQKRDEGAKGVLI